MIASKCCRLAVGRLTGFARIAGLHRRFVRSAGVSVRQRNDISNEQADEDEDIDGIGEAERQEIGESEQMMATRRS